MSTMNEERYNQEDVSWRELISDDAAEHGDNLDNFACTLDSDGLDRRFKPGYGSTEGKPFTAWSTLRVYFPVQYDGCEWVGSVPRNPCDEAAEHFGGG